MSTGLTRREQIISSLADPEYRRVFVESRVATTVSFQIREMRQQRDWTQAELGVACGGKSQEWISQLENPHYRSYSLKTLLALAYAFDCDVDIRFRPFSRLVDWLTNRQTGDLRVQAYQDDSGLHSDLTAADETSTGELTLHSVQTQAAKMGMGVSTYIQRRGLAVVAGGSYSN